jgi:uncharacterized LabA/DUF88 family protein
VSKNVAVFVDVANLYYAARGQDVDVDYVALLKHATKGRDLIRAYAYSGLDPENENQKKFLDFLGKNGYRVVAKDIRKFGDGRVKANLDIELVVDLFRLAERMDVAVIVSGDGDFAPAIRALQDVGVRCEVISFRPNTSSDLFAVADEFHDVMKISAIGRQKDAKGVGAPEMPAKEVNPDVGFREASPTVAAAALAAIRSDGDEPAGRGRGRSTGRRSGTTGRAPRGRTPTAAEEPVAAADAATATPARSRSDAEDDGGATGRRRRRRGGRGRGRRGRRGDPDETVEVAAAGEPTEIQWDEVDSLEELDGGAGVATASLERDMEFEEADAATLAELGLSAEPSAAGADAAGADEAEPTKPVAKPRSRTRTSTKAAAGSGATGKTTSSRPRTTRSAAKPATKTATKPRAVADTASDPDPDSAPKPRTRAPRKPKPAPDVAAAADAVASGDQGIWQRFTSGRTSGKKTTPPTEA